MFKLTYGRLEKQGDSPCLASSHHEKASLGEGVHGSASLLLWEKGVSP